MARKNRTSSAGARSDQAHQERSGSAARAPGAVGIRIGYARHYRDDEPDLQVAALREAGCEQVFEDHETLAAGSARPRLATALSALKSGDTLVVWRLDRLGHSLAQLVDTIDDLVRRGIHFRSLSEDIDTSAAGGDRVHQVMTALATSERRRISERTRAGMQAAQSQGRVIGRRPALNQAQKQEIREAVLVRGEPLDEVAQEYGVHPRTVRRALAQPTNNQAARKRTARTPRASKANKPK